MQGDEQPELSFLFEPISSPIKQMNIKPDLRYSDELENKFKQFLEIINEPIETWEPVLQKPGLVIVKTFKTGNSAVFVKGYVDIESTKEILFKAIYDQEFRVYWDKVLMDFHIVERESEDVDIVYYYVESPFGVANRDFCQKRIVRRNFPQREQDSLMYFSCENKNAPNVKKFVRAQTLISGYIMEELPDKKGVRLFFVSNNDVKGNIPKVGSPDPLPL